MNKETNQLGAILLAKTIEEMYPEAMKAIISLNEDGFHCAFSIKEGVISSNNFNAIKKQMKKNIDRAEKIVYENVSRKQACEIFANNKFKLDLINESKDDQISIIRIGDHFCDLCDKLSLNKLSLVGAFELFNVSGYYWKNDAKNEQLVAISGAAFTKNEELTQFIAELQDRQERNHRKIGKEMELFFFDNLAGQGLPFWLPNGWAIKHEIESFVLGYLRKNDFNVINSPILGSKDLYITSGHWSHYRENMFSPVQIDEETLVLRPMTCPHHMLVYKHKNRSYRELPFRVSELACLHRYESSGSLIGLERVRQMYLIDTHVLVTKKQIKEEIANAYKIISYLHKVFNLELHSIDLSLSDPNNKEKFFDDQEMWDHAESSLKNTLEELDINYTPVVGEAAFYGPKIDFQVKTSLGRVITLSTIQLDFLLPERFDLSYKNENNENERPILIHIGLIGTLERFISILLEQTKGKLPLWLAPKQIVVISVLENKHKEYCLELINLFKEHDIRCLIDDSNERLSKKIRDAQVKKIPYQIIIGDDELAKREITYRQYGSKDSVTMKVDEFIEFIKSEIKSLK